MLNLVRPRYFNDLGLARSTSTKCNPLSWVTLPSFNPDLSTNKQKTGFPYYTFHIHMFSLKEMKSSYALLGSTTELRF